MGAVAGAVKYRLVVCAWSGASLYGAFKFSSESTQRRNSRSGMGLRNHWVRCYFLITAEEVGPLTFPDRSLGSHIGSSVNSKDSSLSSD